MFPGYGNVVANASGMGVHDAKPYCGHGGGGGVTARAAFCWSAVCFRVGLRIGCAEAAVAQMSEPRIASERVVFATVNRFMSGQRQSAIETCGPSPRRANT